MTKEEYVRKTEILRESLRKIVANQLVSVGNFASALKYILEKRLGTQSVLYNAEYGELDFSANVIRFRLKWQPKSVDVKLMCKHIEGASFMDAPYDPRANDPVADLLGTIDSCIENVGPFDTEMS